MKYEWQDLPKPMNCFTVRSAVMINLNTKEIVRYYSANTKIVVTQKCVTPTKTYYRTGEAAHHYLNYAFEASAFGLPNEIAPSVPQAENNSSFSKSKRLRQTARKQNKNTDKVASPKDGEERRPRGWLSKILRRFYG